MGSFLNMKHLNSNISLEILQLFDCCGHSRVLRQNSGIALGQERRGNLARVDCCLVGHREVHFLSQGISSIPFVVFSVHGFEEFDAEEGALSLTADEVVTVELSKLLRTLLL